MPGPKIAVQLAGLRQPFKQALLTAAKLGATAVEIDARGEINAQTISSTGLRDLRSWLGDLDLRVSAVSFHTRRGLDNPEEIERRVQATKAVMKFAHGIGSAVVVNQVGLVARDPHDAAYKLLVEVLTDLSLYGHQVGARIAAQTGNEGAADLAKLFDVLPPQGIGLDLDPGKLIVGGFSPQEVIETLGDHILHVHATDAVQDRARGRGEEVALGEGKADYPLLCASLEERGYRGYFTVTREPSSASASEIARGVKFLKQL